MRRTTICEDDNDFNQLNIDRAELLISRYKVVINTLHIVALWV